MLPWIIQISVISLILIILVHYLFTFFKTNLTIPKVKDLVNKPQQQYEKLFDTMNQNSINQNSINNNNNNITEKNTSSDDNMKNELKNYLKELSTKKTEVSSSNVNKMDGIMTLDTMGSSAYSSY